MYMQLVIFDLDGTLTQTTRIDESCFVRAAVEALGAATVDRRWAEYAHTTDLGIAIELFQRGLGRAPTREELARLEARFVSLLEASVAHDSDCCIETPGARAMLQRLKKEPDWRIAIATGSWRAAATLKMRTVGIPTSDIPAAFADNGPSRDHIVQTAITRAQGRYRITGFSRIVSVGDAVWDVRTAARLALSFLGVASGRRADALRREGASHVVADFTDVDRLLRTLGAARVPANS